MADANGADEAQPQQRFSIQKIYIKDCSFETPNSPHIFLDKWEPEVSLQIGNNAQELSPNMHEVTLSITITAKLKEKVAYLAEIQQAGIFQLEGFASEELGALIGAYCPNLLFPYAREAVSDIVTKGGFPQMLLNPINFDALYAQHVQQKQAEAEQQQGGHVAH